MNAFNRANDSSKIPFIRTESIPMANLAGSNIPPGGRDQTKVVSEIGDKMQYAFEGGREYKGSAVKNIANKTFFK